MPLWGLTMIVTKEDIMNLIFHKCFYGVAIGETKSKVVSLFGEPIHFEPQRKNREIYLYNSLVMEVSIDFSKSSSFKLKDNISIHSLINILDDQCIEYKIELNEEEEYDFISFNSIQVGFLDNKLSYIWLS